MNDRRNGAKARLERQILAVRMMAFPVLMSLPALVLWHFLYTKGWHSTRAADEPTINYLLPGLLVGYFYLAGRFMSHDNHDRRTIRQAVKHSDKPESREAFLETIEDRLAIHSRFLLFTTAFIVEGWTIALYYDLYWTGFFSVFSMGYVLSLIWEIVAYLNDPIHGPHAVKKVPEEWLREAHVRRRWSDRFFEWSLKGKN